MSGEIEAILGRLPAGPYVVQEPRNCMIEGLIPVLANDGRLLAYVVDPGVGLLIARAVEEFVK